MAAVLSSSKTYIYEFENYRLVPSERLLLCDGQPVSLQPKIFETLLVLVEKSGHLVEKDELMTRLWPDTFVEEATLARNISDLRKSLRENGSKQQKYIETVSKRGYRFVAEVRRLSDEKTAVEEQNHAGEIAVKDETPVEEETQQVEPQKSYVAVTERSGSLRVKRKTLIFLSVAIILFLGLITALVIRSSSWFSKPAGVVNDISHVRSIAVLPFKSVVETEGRDETLELGIADALITRLSNVNQISVRPSRAVFKYAGQNADTVEAGKELKVDAVLNGSIQRLGERIRITVQLVSVPDGKTLWADKFDSNITDLFAMQDSFSEQIARSLTLKITGAEHDSPAKRGTSSEQAYQLYLKGMHWRSKTPPESYERAIEYFNQAITIDKNYASAYAALSDCYSLQASTGILPPAESLMKARVAAERAVQLDDSLVEVHLSLGHLKWLTWDWTGAEKEFRRAVELNPPYPAAHLWYAVYLSSLGRHQEAFAIIEKAQQQSPMSIVINECAERTQLFARQYDETIATGLKNLELEPDRAVSLVWIALAYEMKGMHDEAIATHLKILSLKNIKGEDIEALRSAYAQKGWRGYWIKQIELNQKEAKQKYIPLFEFAEMYTRIGDKEHALEFLEKAYSERADQLTLLKVHPVFDPLRSDSRYRELMRRVGFTD